MGKCQRNDRTESDRGAAEIGSRNTGIEHRIPLFNCLNALGAPFRRFVVPTIGRQRFQDGCVGVLKWFRRKQN
jgi:hypothetical protein